MVAGETVDRVIRESFTRVYLNKHLKEAREAIGKNLFEERQGHGRRVGEKRLRGNPRPDHTGL